MTPTSLINSISRNLRAAVAALIADARNHTLGQWTPADFPSANLSQTDLDSLATHTEGAEDIYELAPTQHGILFHALAAPGSDVYFNQLTCVLTGPLDVSAFLHAWQATAERHPALRTAFHWKDIEHPVQVVTSRVEAPWTIEDWTDSSPDQQQQHWHQQLHEDRQRPFNVSSPPLMRFGLNRVAPQQYWFRWSQHHLLLDGWSSAIVLNDVLTAYDSETRDGPSESPAAPRPFRDHIDWIANQSSAAAERFWRSDLEGFSSATPLALGAPELDGHIRPTRFAEFETILDDGASAAIRDLCAEHGLTLNTAFQGIWSLLLSRQSGETDIVFGAIVSGRAAELDRSDEMVGVFINTIPVRTRIDEESPVIPWLRELQRKNSERDAYSYCALAEVQDWSTVEAGAPLFETIFIFENYPVDDSIEINDRNIAISDVQAFEPNNYPITFIVTPGTRIGLKIMYDEGRFDHSTVERTMGHIRTLVAGILGQADQALGTLSILSENEHHQLLATWGSTERPLPVDTTVVQLIEAHARELPEQTAVLCEDRSLNYAALNARANQLARALEQSGTVKDSCVAVLLARSERLLETVLALWKCGAVYVPIDPKYPTERITTIITGSRASLIVTDHDAKLELSGDTLTSLAPVVTLEEIADTRALLPTHDLRRPVQRDALAYVIFTSGSTGIPKGAMVEHVGMLNHILSMVDDLSIEPCSTIAQTASHCFDISIWQLFAALVSGGTTAIYPEHVVVKPLELSKQLSDDQVTIVQFVPSYLHVFMDALEGLSSRPHFKTLSHLVLIGEELKHAAVTRWFNLYHHIRVMNAYGPTEASDSITHHDMVKPPEGTTIPIGRPIQNMAIYIVDRNMRLCPVGVKGEICVAGIGVGRGYLHDPVRTNEVFLEDPFSQAPSRRMYRTGDIGAYAPDGTIRFFGRRDFQVKIRGYRIEIGEIEARLIALEGIRDAVVLAREAPGGDAFLCAYLTRRSHTTLDEQGVATSLATQLPHYAVPDMLRFLTDMPVMSNGKIDRRALAKRVETSDNKHPFTAATTEIEKQLTDIWCAVLQRATIGVDDTFFELGGHSLKAIEIASRISRDCDVDISIVDVLQHHTIRELAQTVASAGSKPFTSIPPLPPQDNYEVSATQKRMWLASRTKEGSIALNMAGAFELSGDLDIPALRQAFQVILERHESLRTVFTLAGGELRQRVLHAKDVNDILLETDRRSERLTTEAAITTLRDLATAPFDLSNGPLFGIDLVRVGDQRHHLLARMHHIIGDALSIQILLNETLTLYAAFKSGTPSPLPQLQVQYRDFTAWQNARAANSTDENRKFWQRKLGPETPRAGFLPDHPRSDERTFQAAHVDCLVDSAQTAALRGLASRHNTTLFGVALSGVYALLYRHTGLEDFCIGIQTSRRMHPQLRDQIGCYIDTLVLRGQVRHDDTAEGLVERTAQVMHEGLAHQDYSFDTLLEEQHITVPQGRTPIFDVLVDHVSRPDNVVTNEAPAGLRISELPIDTESAQYETTFLVTESDDGTTLAIRLVFDAELFDPSTLQSTRDRLRRMLAWLAEGGSSTLGKVDLFDTPAVSKPRFHVQLNTD